MQDLRIKKLAQKVLKTSEAESLRKQKLLEQARKKEEHVRKKLEKLAETELKRKRVESEKCNKLAKEKKRKEAEAGEQRKSTLSESATDLSSPFAVLHSLKNSGVEQLSNLKTSEVVEKKSCKKLVSEVLPAKKSKTQVWSEVSDLDFILSGAPRSARSIRVRIPKSTPEFLNELDCMDIPMDSTPLSESKKQILVGCGKMQKSNKIGSKKRKSFDPVCSRTVDTTSAKVSRVSKSGRATKQRL